MSVLARPGGIAGLDVAAFVDALERGAVPVDLRPARDYLTGHIPGAMNIPFSRKGMGDQIREAVPAGHPVALVADNAVVAQAAATQFAAAGYRVVGYLAGGMAAWSAAGWETVTAGEISVQQLHVRLRAGDGITVIDVREPYEWAAGHLEEARLIPLSALGREAASLDSSREYAVICATGARSSVACAILQQRGVTKVYNVSGGMAAWREAGLPVTR